MAKRNRPEVGCYLPGDQAADYRAYNAAKLIAGTDIAFHVHYTPNGNDAIDVPLLGFTVSEAPPAKRWLSTSAGGPGGSVLGRTGPCSRFRPTIPTG